MDKDYQNGKRVIIIDDELVTVRRLVQALKKANYEVEGFVSAKKALSRIKESPPEVVVTDVRLGEMDGIQLMEELKSIAPETAVIIITGYASISHAVEATKKGAFHYLAKPFRLGELKSQIQKAIAHIEEKKRKDQIEYKLKHSSRFGEIIGVSPAMKRVFKTIVQIAQVDCNVFIQGESGTGKELVARALHANSPRSSKPFISFNCGAFTEELVTNELFGHEKGAFTGAVSTKIGLLEAANGGTVFFDEIGEMPLSMQVKLLRVIQERSFRRVGGIEPINLDVRFIAATNRDIKKMVEEGKFRQDLFYRLKVVMIELPPLRNRPEDIPSLVVHFASKAAKKFGKKTPNILEEFIEPLKSYSFPGNVRELEHIIERAVALTQDDTLKVSDLPPEIISEVINKDHEVEVDREDKVRPLKSLEREYIYDVYRRTGFNQTETARILGISRTTLWRRLRHFNLLHKQGEESN